MLFVQIASYRDPELIPTVLDLVEKANDPKQLRIVVAWQHDDLESIDPIKHLIEYIDIPCVDSKGVCWARNLIQQKYNNEEYTLHLDSHHRFVKGWDTLLLNMYQQCKDMGSERPLLTTYLPNYDPFTGEFLNEAWQMKVEKFMDDGPLFFVPEPILNFQNLEKPIPARFYSAHFAFTDGSFCKLVPHDLDYYFYGEETNIAVRAFTNGYDLYHPHQLIAWHQYKRSYRPTHWNDNINNTKKSWIEYDSISTKKHRILFKMEKSNENFLNVFGSIRSLHDYETYAGIRFSDKYISKYTLDNNLPPNPID
jgi:hypothetical protein